MERFITLILIGMFMLTGCSSEGLATVSNSSPGADEKVAAEAACPDEGSAVKSVSPAETGPDDTQAESAETGLTIRRQNLLKPNMTVQLYPRRILLILSLSGRWSIHDFPERMSSISPAGN